MSQDQDLQSGNVHKGATGDRKRASSTLVNRNVFIGDRRTSVRLEPAMWDALAEICQRERISLHEFCEMMDERRHASSFTAAIRVFVVTYFRAATTEEGHARTGHGTFDGTRARARNRDAGKADKVHASRAA